MNTSGAQRTIKTIYMDARNQFYLYTVLRFFTPRDGVDYTTVAGIERAPRLTIFVVLNIE